MPPKGKEVEKGQRFGSLVVIREAEREKGDYRRRFVCRCDCGNETQVPLHHLASGRTRSCGCLGLRKTRERHDCEAEMLLSEAIGKRFGKLVAVEYSGRNERGLIMLLCICDCGNRTVVPLNGLKTGNWKSCGCGKSKTIEKAHLKLKDEYKEGTSLCALTAKLSVANKSGYKGVQWNTQTQRWKAVINFKGKRYVLGFYKNIEDAVKARKLAEEELFYPILEKYGRPIQSQ